MLNELVLTNWRQHTQLTVNFTGGVQALRGANEAGKSSILWAVAYAWFGTRAVPTSFANLVTWGQPEGSLRVELTFTHAGNSYKIVRKKSGAELAGAGVTASGHEGVSNFVERLFGAAAPTVLATLVANQQSLKDGLTSGSVSLIEDLSNMSLIDELIGKISSTLVSGNTKALTAQIATCGSAEAPTCDWSALEAEVIELEDTAELANEECEGIASTLASLKPQVKEIEDIRTANKALAGFADKLDRECAQLATALPPEAVEDPAPQVAQLAAESANAAILAVFGSFVETKWPVDYINMTEKELETAHDNLVTAHEQHTKAAADCTTKAVTAEALIVTVSACGLCGKDLQNIPEVVEKNTELRETVAQQSRLRDQHLAERAAINSLMARYTQLMRSSAAVRKACAGSPNLLALDDTRTPPAVSWIGPDPDSLRPTMDASQVQSAVSAFNAYKRKLQAYEADQQKLAHLRNNREAIKFTPEPDNAENILVNSAMLTAKLAGQKGHVSWLTSRAESKRKELDVIKYQHAAALAQHAKQAEQRETLLKLLADMNENNTLIDRLREVRPIVARELWQLVLVGVSHYFSQIRGQLSIVTRTDKSFAIDGKDLATYSGSTQDALGLAVRLVLLKTFLPNMNMLIVDEPGAACDESRESAMLGVLASSGLDQVLVVTHSTLADSFAANVIRL